MNPVPRLQGLDTLLQYADIGNLMVQYANNESVFLGIISSLLGDPEAAHVVFFSHKNTQGRMELLSALAVEKIADAALLDEFQALHRHFKNLGKTRNFYAHARYGATEEGDLVSAVGIVFDNQTKRFRENEVALDAKARHELRQCAAKLKALNERLWAFSHRLDDWLRAQTEGQPRLPPSLGFQKLIRPTPQKRTRRQPPPQP
jgi:hypothetical protein